MKRKSKRRMKRKIIQTGLVGSMAGMIGTGIAGHKKAHIATSALFTGLTLWHCLQYRPAKKLRPVRTA
ncbi:MAG: hypothetical protein MI863_21475 [Desulfobacterales bacterium]|nr:hypothetical protein [Desulfobacterales bacterium]